MAEGVCRLCQPNTIIHATALFANALYSYPINVPCVPMHSYTYNQQSRQSPPRVITPSRCCCSWGVQHMSHGARAIATNNSAHDSTQRVWGGEDHRPLHPTQLRGGHARAGKMLMCIMHALLTIPKPCTYYSGVMLSSCTQMMVDGAGCLEIGVMMGKHVSPELHRKIYEKR